MDLRGAQRAGELGGDELLAVTLGACSTCRRPDFPARCEPQRILSAHNEQRACRGLCQRSAPSQRRR